jgi:hypothetical protein
MIAEFLVELAGNFSPPYIADYQWVTKLVNAWTPDGHLKTSSKMHRILKKFAPRFCSLCKDIKNLIEWGKLGGFFWGIYIHIDYLSSLFLIFKIGIDFSNSWSYEKYRNLKHFTFQLKWSKLELPMLKLPQKPLFFIAFVAFRCLFSVIKKYFSLKYSTDRVNF